MARKNKLLGKLTIIALSIVAFIAVHEEVHALIFRYYGVSSEIEWFSFPPRTVPDQGHLAQLSQAQLENLQLLHSLNEVLTYGPLLAIVLFVLVKK